jgi:hypothetical protein
MSGFFEPSSVNRMPIKNRFVRSATMDNMGSAVMVTEAQTEESEHSGYRQWDILFNQAFPKHLIIQIPD